MIELVDAPTAWPEPPREWEPTRATFHLWTQVIGKIRMACTPITNHWWNIPLYVTSRGLTTSLMPHPSGRGFQIDFDLLDHNLIVTTTGAERRTHRLEPQSVADFYAAVIATLADLDLDVHIWTMPVEIEGAIPFDSDDVHASYDAAQVQRFWQTLLVSQRAFELFRSRFLGKASPVHLFWGGLDLAASRFSGRSAPPYPRGVPNCAPFVMHEAYSREVSSSGYWPGPTGECLYYSYVYPEPVGFAAAKVLPGAAKYDASLGEFTLSYDAVRSADDPQATLLQFLQTTYEAAANHAGWDRAHLERVGA